MKNHETNKSFFSFALSFVIALVLFSSCHKNQKCYLEVIVQDGKTGAPVGKTAVRVYSDQPGADAKLDKTEYTDISGVTNFVYELPAMLKAEVTSSAISGSTSKYVELSPGKKKSVVISIY